jgi:hypothetical protein
MELLLGSDFCILPHRGLGVLPPMWGDPHDLCSPSGTKSGNP